MSIPYSAMHITVRRQQFTPTEPIPTSIANDRYGA